MLLRSTTEHVRSQNWFAASIDFVIVVVGVFIGLQASNWNNSNAERERTERLIVALTGDLTEIREQLVSQREHYFEVTTELDRLLSSMESKGDVNPEQAANIMAKALTFRVPPAAPARLSELLVDGRIDLLEQASLDEAIRSLAKDLSIHSKAVDSLLKEFLANRGAVLPYIFTRRNPNRQDGKDYYAIESVDIDSISASPELASKLTTIYMTAGNMQQITQLSINAIDQSLLVIN